MKSAISIHEFVILANSIVSYTRKSEKPGTPKLEVTYYLDQKILTYRAIKKFSDT